MRAAHPHVHFQQYDFYAGAPMPGSDYDVVLAIEVFLHHPPEVVGDWLRKLATIGRHIVNIDWSEQWPGPTPPHVWVHDFATLYAQADLQCAVFPVPKTSYAAPTRGLRFRQCGMCSAAGTTRCPTKKPGARTISGLDMSTSL